MGFRLVPQSLTLNDPKRRNGRYLRYSIGFAAFGANYIKVAAIDFIEFSSKI